MFSINYQSQTPVYRQLYDQTIRFASLGVLLPGSKLPTVRSLATELGINPNTVAKAYALLENDGYIASTVGRGSFITDKLSGDSAIKIAAEKDFREAVAAATHKGLSREQMLEIIEEQCQKT